MLAPRRLPPLSTLRALEAVVRLGSVNAAAKAQHVTDGAISRALRELEAQLGFALFRRSNRALHPTPVAVALAEDVAHGIDVLSVAIERAHRTTARGRPLVISCEPTFLIRWLIPRLPELQAAIGGERELRFVSAGGAVPFAKEGIDLAIRRADFSMDSEVLSEPFLEERIGPVCRPDFAIDRAAHVLGGVLLHTETRKDAWPTWSELQGIELHASRELTFEHFYQSLQGAVAGVGVAIGPVALVADDVAAGVLTAPWSFKPDGTHYVLMAATQASIDYTFNAVLVWLRDAVTKPSIDVSECATRDRPTTTGPRH